MKILLYITRTNSQAGRTLFVNRKVNYWSKPAISIRYYRSNWDVDNYSHQRLQLVGRTVWARDVRQQFGILLDQEKPDVVHVHNTFVMVSPSIFAACREADVPVVQTRCTTTDFIVRLRLFLETATFVKNA